MVTWGMLAALKNAPHGVRPAVAEVLAPPRPAFSLAPGGEEPRLRRPLGGGGIAPRRDDAERQVAHVRKLVIRDQILGRDQLDAGALQAEIDPALHERGGEFTGRHER